MFAKLTKSFLFIFSSIGLIYQLNDVTQFYLSYLTINQIRIHYPDHIRLPEIVVCHFVDAFVSDQAKNTIAHLRRNNSLTTQFVLDAQPPLRSFFKSCCVHSDHASALNNYSNSDDCFNNLVVRRFVKDGEVVCNSIGAKSLVELNSTLVRVKVRPTILLYLDYTAGATTIFPVYLTRPDSPISERSNSVIYLQREKLDIVNKTMKLLVAFIRYEEVYSEMLPTPYDTNCIDYASTYGCESRQDCRDRCLAEKSLQTTGLVHQYVATDRDHYLRERIGQVQPEELNTRIVSECEEMFNRGECETVNYVISAMTHQFEEFGSSNTFHLTLHPPTRENIYCKAQPRIILQEFIPLCLSVISFWFGLSPLTLDDTVAAFFKYFVKHGYTTQPVNRNQLLHLKAQVERRMEQKFRHQRQEYLQLIGRLAGEVAAIRANK